MLAIVLSRDGRLPSGIALARALSERISGAAGSPEAASGETALFFVDDTMVALAKVSAPAPIAKDDPCVVSAWHWPNAWKEIEPHAAHVVVSATGGADAKRRAHLLGRAVAAVIEATPDPCAVHWASSDALWSATLVAEIVAKAGAEPPIPVSVAVKLSRDADGGVSAITKGLAAFDLMEIEARGISAGLPASTSFILDLADYLINAGDVIADGDTIGSDAATKITVRREVSGLVPGQNVYRLYFPRSKKA